MNFGAVYIIFGSKNGLSNVNWLFSLHLDHVLSDKSANSPIKHVLTLIKLWILKQTLKVLKWFFKNTLIKLKLNTFLSDEICEFSNKPCKFSIKTCELSNKTCHLSEKPLDFFYTICQLSDKTSTALGHVSNLSESIGRN